MRFRRLFTSCLSLALAGGLWTASTTAYADEVPADQRLQVQHVSLSVGGGVIALDVLLGLGGPTAPPGTAFQTTVCGCGRDIAEGSGSVAETGKAFLVVELADYDGPNRYMPTVSYPAFSKNYIGIDDRELPGDFIAETFSYSTVVTTPGRDPYVLTGSQVVDGLTKPPTCAAVNQRLATAIVVTQWSDKIGKPKVGRRLKVTPTLAPGATVSYRWTAFKKGKARTVSKKPSIKVEREHKRYLAVTVRVSQPGRRTVREVIEF